VIFDGFRAQAELSVKNQLSTVGWAVLNRPVSPLLLANQSEVKNTLTILPSGKVAFAPSSETDTVVGTTPSEWAIQMKALNDVTEQD
jgi:hypothetical protein